MLPSSLSGPPACLWKICGADFDSCKQFLFLLAQEPTITECTHLLYSVIDVQQHCLRKVFTIIAPCEGEEEGWEQERKRGGEEERKDRRGGKDGGGELYKIRRTISLKV